MFNRDKGIIVKRNSREGKIARKKIKRDG